MFDKQTNYMKETSSPNSPHLHLGEASKREGGVVVIAVHVFLAAELKGSTQLLSTILGLLNLLYDSTETCSTNKPLASYSRPDLKFSDVSGEIVLENMQDG